MPSSDVIDAYNLLGISPGAREDEINKAFRQKSLKVHPDRNPDNPEAAQKFHELKQAQELLLDPQRRAELDASLKRQQDYAERYANANAKRKEMMDALEERERETKRAKTMTAVEKRKEEEKLQELKEASRRMREEREGPVKEDTGQKQTQEEEIQIPEDIPVTIKYKPAKRPDLLTESAIVDLFRQFGQIDSSMVKLKLKPPKDKPNAAPKFATAVLLFKRVEAAFGAVGASGREDRNLKDVQVDWIGGEPEYIKKLREKGALESGKSSGASGKADNPPKSTPFASSLFSRLAGRTPLSGGTFDSFPDLDGTDTPHNQPEASKTASAASESVMLLRLRQAERDRLAREIIDAEEKGET